MTTPRSILACLSAWWHRSITVERAHPDFDVTRVRIDHGDGTTPVEVLLSRRETFGLAAVCRELRRRVFTEVVLTVERDQPDGTTETLRLDVPPWAWPAVGDRLQQWATSLGWRGECPRPAARQAYR